MTSPSSGGGSMRSGRPESSSTSVLDDLTERLQRANRELLTMAESPVVTLGERHRLVDKASGVRLALSYVEEVRRG